MILEARSKRRVVTLAAVALCWAVGSVANGGEREAVSWFGDFRARMEQDWDSRDAAGVDREDRLRARVRMRVGLRFRPAERWEFGVRLRSGADRSQQSPHITVLDFNGNANGPAEFNFDRWYAQGTSAKRRNWAWIGRNALPFWKQNALVWSDDVMPAGVGVGGRTFETAAQSLEWRAGYFSLPEGMRSFFGSLATGQGIYRYRAARWKLTSAVGMLAIDANPPGSGGLLLQGNDARDYRIAVGSVQWAGELRGRPLVVGADWIDNRNRYSVNDPDPYTAAHAGETRGFVGSIRWGREGHAGDQSFGLTFAEIGALAVNGSFAQDDWIRWGSVTQTRGNDLRGWELRYVRSAGEFSDMTVRLYLVESISSVEDGKRLRIDFNTRFPRK